VIIFLQTYICLGLAFRIGRQEEIAAHGDGEPFTVEQVNSILARIRAMAWVTIVLTAITVLVSLTMVRRASAEVSVHTHRRAPHLWLALPNQRRAQSASID